jgi:hypothetical protein
MDRTCLPLLASLALAACAATPEPRVVRAADLGELGAVSPGQPLVVVFERGDKIPLTFRVGGPLVATPDGLAPISLEVKRRFYLRITEDGVATSLDGKRFGDVVSPGTFAIGVGATKEGALATVEITTPTLAEPVPDQSR